MQLVADLVVSNSQIMRPLERIVQWRVPAGEPDLADLHHGILQVLSAMQALAEVEVPNRVNLEQGVSTESAAGAQVLSRLLAGAELALAGAAHRERIAAVHCHAPGHAGMLERARRAALEQVRQVRRRVDFVQQEIARCNGRALRPSRRASDKLVWQ